MLEESSPLSILERQEKIHLQQHLRGIMREEEIKWIQRSKENELHDGDNNTKYYHAKANGRKRKTTIVRLFQEEGVIEVQANLENT
jgi:hypothetical protein